MRIYVGELGGYVELPDNPERIVSLAPSVTETLYMLGVWNRVVGVSVYCFKPPEARKKPLVGSYYRVNFDILEKLKPDLILTTTGAQRETLLKIHRAGYPVYPLPLPISVAGIIENVVITGMVVNAGDRARELATELYRVVGDLSNRKIVGRPRIYVELDLGGPITVGAPSYIDNAIYVAGGLNLFGDVMNPYFQPDFNEVMRRDPDILIYEPNPIGHPKDVKQIINNRGWGDLRAVKNGNIIVTPGDYLAHYGPSLIKRVLPEIAEKIAKFTS